MLSCSESYQNKPHYNHQYISTHYAAWSLIEMIHEHLEGVDISVIQSFVPPLISMQLMLMYVLVKYSTLV